MTSTSSSLLGKLPRTVSRLLAVLLGLALAALGLLFMLGALVVGLLAAAGFTLWALLRGRRPPAMRFDWRSGRFADRFGGRFRGPPPPGTGSRSRGPSGDDIVDVEVRELPEPPAARD